MSTIATSGRRASTMRSSASASPQRPAISKPASSSRRARPCAQERLVVGDHEPHGSSARTWRGAARDAFRRGRRRDPRRGPAAARTRMPRRRLDDQPSVPAGRRRRSTSPGRRQPQRPRRRRSRRPTRRRRAAPAGQRAGDEPGLVLGEHLDRRGEPFLVEHRREEAVRELAQRRPARPAAPASAAASSASSAGVAGGVPPAREPDADRERHEALLGAVVEVALEPAALGVGGRDDARARAAQLLELGAARRVQALVLEREPRGHGDLRRPAPGRRAGPGDGRARRPRGRRPTMRVASRPWPAGSVAGATVRVDPALAVVEPVEELQRRVAERRREPLAQAAGRGRRAEVDHEPGQRRTRAPRADAAPRRRRPRPARAPRSRPPTARGRWGRWRGSRDRRPCSASAPKSATAATAGTSTGAATPAARGRGARQPGDGERGEPRRPGDAEREPGLAERRARRPRRPRRAGGSPGTRRQPWARGSKTAADARPSTPTLVANATTRTTAAGRSRRPLVRPAQRGGGQQRRPGRVEDEAEP